MAFWCSRGCCVLVVFCQHSRRIIEGNQGRLPFFRQLFCHAVGTYSVAVPALLGAIWAPFGRISGSQMTLGALLGVIFGPFLVPWCPFWHNLQLGGTLVVLLRLVFSILQSIRRYLCWCAWFLHCRVLGPVCTGFSLGVGLTAAGVPGSRFRHPTRIRFA